MTANGKPRVTALALMAATAASVPSTLAEVMPKSDRVASASEIRMNEVVPSPSVAVEPITSNGAVGRPEKVQVLRPFTLDASHAEVLTLHTDLQMVRQAARQPEGIVVQGFPLRPDMMVDLELTPFHVAGPSTRVVLGRKGGPDKPLDYDPGRIAFLRGRVSGRPGSHVFLAFSDRVFTGSIHLGPGAAQYLVSEKDRGGLPLPPGKVSVFVPRGDAGLAPGVPRCGVSGELPAPVELVHGSADSESFAIAGPMPRVGLQHLELAVETDYEYYSLFGDTVAATDYIFLMYGAVSDIYMRDVDTRIEVVFVRIWTDPNDIINGGDPLQEFRAEWISTMGGVARDNAQFFSGRRDFPFGGQAYLSSICSTSIGYGVVGYALGFFPDPSRPDPYTWDVSVCAHELGHSCGARHTHDLGIDECDDPLTTPQRGSIMAYCSQTWSGMNSNDDSFFHTANRTEMRNHIFSRVCVADDCNMNNRSDATDISLGSSLDVNGNGVPDECEDCQPNGTLDPADIAGPSDDDNGNGIPDECEPDCNNNGTPDSLEIQLNPSLDAYGDGILDSCEEDCNSNSVSDYTEINLNMPLDINRNARLDACEDCDGDTVNDLIELGGAHNLWVATGLDNSDIQQFFASTGVAVNYGGASVIREGQDLIVTTDGRVLVTSALDNSVLQYDDDGGFLGSLVTSGSGGLSYPTGLIFSPAGILLVSSRDTNSVLSYHAVSGTPIGEFVTSGDGGLVGPFGLTFGPNGHLFVTSATNEVLEYDGSGGFVKKFVRASRNGGLSQPRGLIFKSDGNLLVASYGTDEVLEFDGETGFPLGKWAQVGTATAITQDSPWGIRIGPNGNVYVTRTGAPFSSSPHDHGDDVDESHLTDARMFEFNVCTGDHRRTHIGGNDHGLFFATGFDFRPGWILDCNRNQIQDDCDISSGTSLDLNTNNIPDECEVDCNGNSQRDNLDLIPFGSSYDCNCNAIPDECEPSTIDCDNNGIPDECEDCNGNGIGDGCDIADCAGDPACGDCNSNGIPDGCESATDCDNDSIQDICEIFEGAPDCNDNEWLDSCEAAGGGLVLDVDFESGLPAGWSVSGIFQITSACSVGTPCSGTQWAYAGNTGSCDYGDNEFGELLSPAIALAYAPAELRYCSYVDTEAAFDFADVYVNGQLVAREDGFGGQWNSHSVDLTPFAGQVITLSFQLASDAFVSGTLGWQVDNIQVISGSPDCDSDGELSECEPDCNGNLVADDCDITENTSQDLNSNGIPDECEPALPGVVVWDPETNPGPWPNENPEAATRALRLRVNAPATATGTPGQDAIRITMIDLQNPNPPNLPQFPPPDFSAYEAGGTCTDPSGCARWVGRPSTFYETQGPPLTGPYRAARLQCTPFYWDWVTETAADPMVVIGAEIVPSSEYSVQAYASSCKGVEGSCTNVSAAVTMYTRRSGDVDSEYNPPSATNQPNAIDVAQLVNKFKNAAGSPNHFRAQLQPNLPELNASINALDIVAVVDSVKGFSYAFPGPCPCPSTVTCGGSCAGCPGMCVKTCIGGDNDGEPCINNNHCPSGTCAAVGTCRDQCGRCTP